ELDGQQAEDRLHEVGITVNRNAVPNDPRPPRVTSGLRIGTPALATRGFGAEEFTEVADIIALALTGDTDLASLRARTEALAAKAPQYPELQQYRASPWGPARRCRAPHPSPLRPTIPSGAPLLPSPSTA